jgi:hypothetical protein
MSKVQQNCMTKKDLHWQPTPPRFIVSDFLFFFCFSLAAGNVFLIEKSQVIRVDMARVLSWAGSRIP